MPRKKTTKARARTTHNLPPAEEDRKPDILQPPSRPLKPISRIHRAELNALLDRESVELSVSFCNTWAMERGVDPAFVTDWVRRRSRRTSGFSAQRMDEALIMSSDNIRVKRERAASPILSGGQPAQKRSKGPHHSSDPTESSRPLVQSTPGHGVRHTRAHDGNPHPSCPTCTPSSNPALPPVFGSASSEAMSTMRSSVSAGPRQLSVAARLASRLALKSALRVSSPSNSAARVPRRVRFSHELYSEALAAYTRTQSSQAASYDSRKRNRDTIEDEKLASAKDSDPSRAVPGNYSFLSAELSSPNSPPPGDSTVIRPLSTSTMSNTSCASSSRDNDAPQPQTSSPSSSASSKRINLSPSSILHTEGQPSLSALVPGHFNAAGSSPPSPPAVQNIDIVSAVTPRTPSPRPPSGSFFSPTFFSPTGSSSSGEEEVEALLTSSPPTSPFLTPRSSSPCMIVSPSPQRLCSSSVVDTLERHVSPEHIERVPTALRTPSPHSLPPPADIPPRPRTPPNSGPGPGSTTNTPQPNRPARPGSEDHIIGVTPPGNAVKNTDCAQQSPFPPRARTPPCPPAIGSRQCTPEPRQPPRPVVDRRFDGYFAKDAFIRMLMREEEEDGEPEHDVPVTVVTHQPQDLPPRARSPHDGHPSSKLCMPEPVRPSRPGAVAPTRCSPPLMNICDSGLATHHNPVQSSSRSQAALSPSNIPLPVRTPPGGTPLGSQHGTPQLLRPTRPSVDDADVDICASTVSIDVPTHILPLPPRVRTPPGAPTAGSQPCTPQPGRPVRPSGDEAAQDTDRRLFDDQLAEACLAMVTTLSILKVKRGLTECEAAFKAGDGLFVSADEDNKPVVAASEAPEQTKNSDNKPRPAKGKGKTAPSAVKLEDSSIASGQAQVTATAQKAKREVKPKTGKKAKAVHEVAVKLEQIAASTTKKPRKKGPTKSAAVPGENVNNPTAAARAGKKKKAGGRKAGATPKGQGDASAPIQVHLSLSRTSSLQKRESYKEIRHPPRTCSYVPDHLQALGTVLWDAEGFECMELSALPWLAATAQHAHGGNEVRIREWDEAETPLVNGRAPVDKRYQMIFAPDVPEHIFMDEEDVRLRLYAHGPLPASFLDGLGRAVSVRRRGSTGDVETDEVADT